MDDRGHPGPSELDSVYDRFTGVACSSPTACTLVGWSWPDIGDGKTTPLINRWNGTKWSQQRATFPKSSTEGSFGSVACPTATSCYATGSFGWPWVSVIEHWNGTKWTSQALPAGTNGADLGGITCLSNTYCTAVGSRNGHAVILHWNGSKWAAQPAQAVPGSRPSGLSSVGCLAAANCFAAGSSSNSSGGDTRRLVEHWNGKTWSIVFTPLPAGTSSDALFNAVACRRGGTCILAGGQLMERWNGKAFVIETIPKRASDGLAGAACDPVIGGRCIAVGVTGNQFGEPIPLALRRS